MNYSTILMARMRYGEMMREAEKNRPAARVSRAARQAKRTTGRPVIRLAVARTRPTATGR
jgi:hypothetical protein